ncbi:MAG: WYL domain-containing protein [Clostridiales bacterium]|jgi:predicted DNA-binding transcriptional regulator YafY|nr:WYL domain-containing protein [Clostridiales bacterium]
MSKLFSELYGCYYGIVSRIVKRAGGGVSKKDIDAVVSEHGFSETAFHLLPELLDGDWNFLEKRGDLYYSKLDAQPIRPLTQLELSWLKALLSDPRIRLFLSDETLATLARALSGVAPAFDAGDFISVDRHLDGDPYGDPAYIANFRELLKACKNKYPVAIVYHSERVGRSQRAYHPFKLSYSSLNDKFRLLCAAFNAKTQKLNKVTLNLGRIVSVEPSGLPHRAPPEIVRKLFTEPNANPPITLEITKERNALERFLLQFASFDRKTEYDPDRGIYTCQLSYDIADETELLIRILSFGPTVKVLSPQGFVGQIKERLAKQLRLMHTPQK